MIGLSVSTPKEACVATLLTAYVLPAVLFGAIESKVFKFKGRGRHWRCPVGQ